MIETLGDRFRMVKKLFVVGLPGSGKSALARHISEYVPAKSEMISHHRWFTSRYNDYLILDSMFRDDKDQERFEPAIPGGFNITDFSAFDDALKQFGKWLAQLALTKKDQPEEVLIIEFSRNDYQLAFSQFEKDFLRDAFFIYLGADIEVCKKRIQNRISRPVYEDDYPVSDDIFRTYYHGDNGLLLPQILAFDFGINERQVLAFDNNCSIEEAKKKINPFIDHIINPDIVSGDVIDPLLAVNGKSVLISG